MSIGLDIPRVDGLAKLRGTAKYVDDLTMPGMLYGATIRSPAQRGRITEIHFDPAIDWKQYVIVDHRDVPCNEVQLIEHDQPALAATEVRHKYEPILLIAHSSMEMLRQAVRAIRVEIDPLPPVTSIDQPLAAQCIQHGSDNVFKRIDIRKGTSTPIFSKAAHVIEGVYETGSQEHVYLETNGMLVHNDGPQLVIRGSMQCPYYVLKSLTHTFGRDENAFRVIQTPTGGGFGGKEDFPSHLAIHACLLAEKANAPVKMVYDRQEDMAATTKRHPSRVRHRTALDRDGKLLAMEIEVLLDGGAYVTLSPVVLSRGCIHAAGPYSCDHIHVHGEARLTNSPPNGAFRGFGAPQTLFAIERHMDVIADRLGIDRLELRRRNFLRDGQTTATGQVVRDGVDMSAMLDRAMDFASYNKRHAAHKKLNAAHPYLRRGIGVATFYHGAGFTGAGETMLASEVEVEAHADGRIEILTANTDIGQGTETVLAQVAAQRLKLPMDRVFVGVPDTSRVPNSGPTVASRTAMVVGRLIERACDDLVTKLADSTPSPSTLGEGRGEGYAVSRPEAGDAERPSPQPSPGVPGEGAITPILRAWHEQNRGKRLTGRAKYSKPESIVWDEKTYSGDAYAAFSWAVYVAEVEVDLRTFNVQVLDFVALQEVGKVIHPTLAAGQIQGGVAQGIGWALMEEVVTDGGAMKNAQLTNYIIPTSSDLPPIRVFFEEQPSQYGPGGAKGIGELPMDGPAPAIVNAVCEAVGTQSLCTIPLTPERLMNFLCSHE